MARSTAILALVGAGMPVTDAPASLIEMREAAGFANLDDEKPGAAPMDAVNAERKRGGKAKWSTPAPSKGAPDTGGSELLDLPVFQFDRR